MGYTVKLINRNEREAQIRASVLASKQVQDFYDFRGEKTLLKVIRVEIGLLIYRMENFRTYIDQKEYIIKERKPANYFQSGQENETVQQLQHEILAKLARTGRADSITPVIDVLKKEKQREPLLVTHTGAVVNGNRRLAGMRELPDFSHVSCIVLPEDTTPDEIVDIEASLQAKPETRLDYDWIGDCQLIKKLQSINRTPEQIANKLLRKKKEIENSLLALTEADLYLKEWAKAEGEYGRVRDAEQFFKDLPDLLQGKTPELENGSRVIAWALFDNREKLGDRLYAYNVVFGKRAADVLDRVTDGLGLSPENPAPNEIKEDFAIELDEDTSGISYQPLIAVLSDPDRKEEAVDKLIDTCQGIIESEKNKKSGTAALKAVTTAHAKLAEVDLSKASPDTYDAIEKQLDAVLKKASELKEKLQKYKQPKPTAP